MKTLVKSNDFPLLKSVMEDFWNADRFFNKPVFVTDLLPAVNIRDKKDGYELDVSAPGFKKEDFRVSIENGLLTISGETNQENEEEKDNYTRREFSRSSFSRSFNLPENIEEDHIKASYQDGLLSIVLKKSTESQKAIKQVKID